MLGKTPRGEAAIGAGVARENGEGSGKVEACKGVPPQQGWVHGKVFYVDKEECPGAEKIELRIKALGGQIEGFLNTEKSMRMHYIITREAALDRITGQNQGKKPDGGKYSSVGPPPAVTCLHPARCMRGDSRMSFGWVASRLVEDAGYRAILHGVAAGREGHVQRDKRYA